MPKSSLFAAIFCAVFGFTSIASAEPVSLDNCTLISKANTKSSGRFIWKPNGAHFDQAVIVAPRYYFPTPPNVQILANETNNLVDRATVKSTGLCFGNRECLFAASYLVRKNGAFYHRRYGSIKVKITARAPGKACTYYVIKRPDRRAEFINPASVIGK